jgi:ribonuclease G
MAAEILINRSLRETRVARIEGGQLVEIHIERNRDRGIVGNIYRGRVTRVLPGMQAAFLEIGLQRTAFLYVTNILDPSKEDDSSVDIDDDEAPTTPDADDDPSDGAPTAPAQKNISELIHEGESVLVQVVKEPMGTKGARLTGYVSIPGRVFVYFPQTRKLGV